LASGFGDGTPPFRRLRNGVFFSHNDAVKFPLFCFLLPIAASAAAQDAPAVDSREMLHQLNQLKEKQSEGLKAQKGKIIQEFTAAASSNASAIDFYEQAIKVTQFEGKNRENTQFRDGKKKEADKLKNAEMQTAVRLHLTYLVLTLRRSGHAEVKELIPSPRFLHQPGAIRGGRVRPPAADEGRAQ
jgi:hypothetical protein